MRKATRTQWIKCSIAILLYLIFLIWVKSWWGLIVVPFIFDIYITKKIPWSFWKKSKNPTVRSVMSWVDAIVFALVAVYFVNIYVFQNYQSPPAFHPNQEYQIQKNGNGTLYPLSTCCFSHDVIF